MADERKHFKDFLQASGIKPTRLSEELGFDRSYINDVFRGKGRWPPELATAWSIHELTGYPLERLGVGEADERRVRRHRFDPRAAEDDVEPYDPPRNSPLRATPGIAYYRLKTNVMELQPRAPAIGDILIVDTSEAALEHLAPEQLVVLRMPLDAADSEYRLLLREYARPGQFFTNRRSSGQIFYIDAPSFAARPRVLGVVRNIHRDA